MNVQLKKIIKERWNVLSFQDFIFYNYNVILIKF